jgi:hypothetical protein
VVLRFVKYPRLFAKEHLSKRPRKGIRGVFAW